MSIGSETPVVTVLTLPVLPLKNSLLLPYVMMPISVGRVTSVAAIEAAMSSEDKSLVVVAQPTAWATGGGGISRR